MLTGGATAMEGIGEIAEQVLGLPTRRGLPMRIGGLVDVVRSPSFSTGVGLVMFGAGQGRIVQPRQLSAEQHSPGVMKRVWSRLAEMF